MNETATPRSRRYLWPVVTGLSLLLAAAYLAGWYVSGERVPSGTTVSGVSIGGLSESEATSKLRSELGPAAEEPVILTYKGRRLPLDPAEAGLSLDLEQTVADAGGGRTWNPIRMVDQLVGDDRDARPVIKYDSSVLESAISERAASLESAPQEPSIRYTPTGRLDISRPVPGVSVDAATTAQRVAGAYLVADQPIPVAADVVAPTIEGAEFRDSLREVARPAVSGPVQLRLPGRTIDLRVVDYAPALSLETTEAGLTPVLDAERLEAPVRALTNRIGERPRNARVVLRGERPVVIPARPGVTIDAEDVAEAVTPVLTETGAARSAEVGESTQQPDFTTKEARELRIRRPVSNFVTYFPYAEYRNINQGRAAELINGTVLKPGELFSFNDTVGERTEANGFVEGFIISNGVFAEELGGGVSQVVTTTYNAAFFAGLEDVEHKPHSFYIDRYPMGREATVAWPTVDLKFRNTTPYGVLIEAWVVPGTSGSSGEMHVRMWSTKYWDIDAGLSEQYDFTSPGTRYDSSDACIATTGYGGFEVDVTRTFRRFGSSRIVDREVDHVTYTPADTVICQ